MKILLPLSLLLLFPVYGHAQTTTVANGNDGVAGTVPKFTGSATLGNSVITSTTGGNVGVGVASPVAPFQIGTSTSVQNISNQSAFANNTYWDGSSWRYINSASAAAIRMYQNNIYFHTAIAGAAGDPITTMDTTGPKMVLFNSGGLVLGNSVIGTDPGAENLKIGGSLFFADGTSQASAYPGGVAENRNLGLGTTTPRLAGAGLLKRTDRIFKSSV
jgi:hypothetical protein